MTTNASFIYYKSKNFGKDLNDKEIKELIEIPTNTLDSNAKICSIPYLDYFKIPGAKGFPLKTTYPGLIIGSGYNHPAQEQSSDFQLGFYFDHTTGMPVIPGSTVKGILKSVFPKKGKDKNKEVSDSIKREKLNYINGVLNNCYLITDENWEKLFEKGNIFFDAYVTGIPGNGKIFAEDYITPHKSQFKNPIPLRFLKIAPNVTFTFMFILKDNHFGDGQMITSTEKLDLFKKILLYFGIGAKRNVGYGNFV